MAVDDTSVYWTTGEGTVLSTPLAGGAIVTLASMQTNCVPIIVDATNVYWGLGNTCTGAIVTAPLRGGIPRTLVEGVAPTLLAVNSTNIFWEDFVCPSGVERVSLDGGNPTFLGKTNGFAGLALDSTSVYFLQVAPPSLDDRNDLLKVPVDGGEPTTLASFAIKERMVDLDPTIGITVDDASVYLAMATGLWKVSKTGGVPAHLWKGDAIRVAVDSSSVYWTDGERSGHVWKLTPK
jgi:hypothetical protein